jgi:Cu+-exporting ATPase
MADGRVFLLDDSTEVDEMAMVTDPVCGMRIDDSEAAARVEYEGETYYFCSEMCRDTFDADPNAYVRAGT